MSKKTKREYRLSTEAEWEYVCREADPFIYLQGWVMGKNHLQLKSESSVMISQLAERLLIYPILM